MTVLYWVLGGFLFAIVGFFLWAMSLPAEVSASRTATIDAPVDIVFDLVTDVGNQGEWRSDIGEVIFSEDGATWTEHTTQGIEIVFEELEKSQGRYAITYSSPQGFTGHWEGKFQDDGGRTKIDIVETTKTEGLIAKAMSRIFAPAGAHIDLYLSDLEAAALSAAESQ